MIFKNKKLSKLQYEKNRFDNFFFKFTKDKKYVNLIILLGEFTCVRHERIALRNDRLVHIRLLSILHVWGCRSRELRMIDMLQTVGGDVVIGWNKGSSLASMRSSLASGGGRHNGVMSSHVLWWNVGLCRGHHLRWYLVMWRLTMWRLLDWRRARRLLVGGSGLSSCCLIMNHHHVHTVV